MTEQAKRIEAQVAAAALGAELMQPMPPFWYRSEYERTDGSWQIVAVDRLNYSSKGWPQRLDYEASATQATRAEAHRLCREQAWAKHRKNTEGSNA